MVPSGRDAGGSIWGSRKLCLGHPWQSRVSKALSPATSPHCAALPLTPLAFCACGTPWPLYLVLPSLRSSRSGLGPRFSLTCVARASVFTVVHVCLLPTPSQCRLRPQLWSLKPPVLSTLVSGETRASWVRWKVGVLGGLGELAGSSCVCTVSILRFSGKQAEVLRPAREGLQGEDQPRLHV